MGIHFLDTFTHLDSPVHRAATLSKLLIALGSVIAIVVTPLHFWPFFAGYTLVLLLVLAVSRIPKLFMIMRLLYIEPFVLGAAVLTLFQPNGGWVFLSVVIKTTLCIITMTLLANTTPFSDLLTVLKRLHVPGLLVTTIALMYRYLFIVLDEAHRMRRARRARTFSRLPTRGWSNLGAVLGRLFVRTHERSERTYAAMCARGWK
jgi:cobalt/nickel transport system permease protein